VKNYLAQNGLKIEEENFSSIFFNCLFAARLHEKNLSKTTREIDKRHLSRTMYRNANISDLINRFEVTNEDFDEKFVRSQPSRIRRDGNEIYDENRSIMKFGTDQEKFFDRSSIFVRKSNMSMSGAKEFVKQLLQRISMLLEMISKFPFPRMSVMSFGLTSLLAIFIAPRGFTEKVLYPGFKIIFTIIYPAYRSFKAVRNKNLKEYLKWIVYWIVFAFFTCFELVTDALLHWFPFYCEENLF
jgi:hypothetical protein